MSVSASERGPRSLPGGEGSSALILSAGGLGSPGPARLWARSRMGPQPGEAGVEVCFQILQVLQSDMKPQRRAGGLPARRGPVGGAVERDHEAFEPAPGITHSEQ